jgi:hypothetical protein
LVSIVLCGLARESLEALGHRRGLGTSLAHYLFNFFGDDLVALPFSSESKTNRVSSSSTHSSFDMPKTSASFATSAAYFE